MQAKWFQQASPAENKSRMEKISSFSRQGLSDAHPGHRKISHKNNKMKHLEVKNVPLQGQRLCPEQGNSSNLTLGNKINDEKSQN